MENIKEKAVEYAKTKHTNQYLIEIVTWDFEAGANYVLDEIEKLVNFNRWAAQDLYKLIEQLKK